MRAPCAAWRSRGEWQGGAQGAACEPTNRHAEPPQMQLARPEWRSWASHAGGGSSGLASGPASGCKACSPAPPLPPGDDSRSSSHLSELRLEASCCPNCASASAAAGAAAAAGAVAAARDTTSGDRSCGVARADTSEAVLHGEPAGGAGDGGTAKWAV